MVSKLPDAISEHLTVDKLSLRHGRKESSRHALKTVVDSLNGENDAERIELEIGGYVQVSTSKYKWVVTDVMMESQGAMHYSEMDYVLYVELINKAGDLEVSLDIDPSNGEIYNLEIACRNNAMNTATRL